MGKHLCLFPGKIDIEIYRDAIIREMFSCEDARKGTNRINGRN